MKPANYRLMTQPERRAMREAYVEEQQGLCHHCQSLLCDPPPPAITGKPIKWSLFPGGRNFLRHPVHLHHDHATDMTIGAVHAYCNAVLWQYHGE